MRSGRQTGQVVGHGAPEADEEGVADERVPDRNLGEVGQGLYGAASSDMERIIEGIGDDPDREGVVDTPRRVAKAYAEVFGGLRQCASEHLGRVFEQKSDELITVTGIGFHSMCEHHLLPFFGKAHVAYLPQGGRVVGLSKLARTVEVFAKRPQLQERLTEQVAEALMEHLDPAGCVVMVEAEHLCMKMRGVKTADSVMTTFVRRGLGDVMIAWENEAFLAINEFGADKLEIVVPSVSIRAEPPVALIDKNADQHKTRAAAEAYLKFLYTDEGQKIIARNAYRPFKKEAADPADLQKLPELRQMTIADFGGWTEAQAKIGRAHV